VDEAEIHAVVIEVAADTIFAIGILHLDLGMIPVLRGQSLRHFFMAIQAFESRRARAELVAAGTLYGSA
jgi:hypothetical protein